jgi:lysophospholipase L1-like esterase
MSTSKSRITQTVLALLAAATGLQGQEPCSDPLQSLARQLTEQRQRRCDSEGLIHCGTNNSDMYPPAAAENWGVNFGDQVTDVGYRGSAGLLSDQSRLNRGIGGRTTHQGLVRFRQDVIDLYNKVVVILVGAKDIVGFDGASSEEEILDNLISMSGVASADGIRVALAPVCSCFTKSTARQRWQERIPEVSELIQRHCPGGGAIYLEFDWAKADGDNLRQEPTSDSVLTNNAGCRVMVLLAEKAVAEALHR